jgi:hypothetical protein
MPTLDGRKLRRMSEENKLTEKTKPVEVTSCRMTICIPPIHPAVIMTMMN